MGDFKGGSIIAGYLVWHQGNLMNVSQLANDANYVLMANGFTGNSGALTLSADGTEPTGITVSAPSYSSGTPVKLLNFKWYNDLWSLGNIRGASTSSLGLGVYLNSTEKYRFGADGNLLIGSYTAYHTGNLGNMTGATASVAGITGLVPAPAAGANTKYLRGDGTWQTPPDTNTTYGNMTGATSSAAGGSGLVPAPSAGQQASFLRGDATWVAAVPLAGGTMTGVLTAQNNTSYTTKQVRNIILSTADASVSSMGNGDIWIKYV